MSDKPTIAVVIPVYNGALYIAEALESVFAQTLPATEVFVIDDASTDSTPEILQSYGDRIRVLRNEKNVGQGASRNRGIAASRAGYIALLDADDRWRGDHLEALYYALNKYPEALLAFSRQENIGTRTGQWPTEIMLELWGKPIDMLLPLMRHPLYIPSATLYRRSMHEELGGFDETPPYGAEDADYFCRAALLGPMVGCLEPTCLYRWHEAQPFKQKWIPSALKYMETRLRLLDVLAMESTASMRWPAAVERTERLWESYLEQAWSTRNLAGLRRLKTFGLHSKVLASSTRPYVWRAMIPAAVVAVGDRIRSKACVPTEAWRFR